MTLYETDSDLTGFEDATAELAQVSAPYATARFPLTPAVLPEEALHEFGAACATVFDGVDELLRGICGGDIRRLGRLCQAEPYELPLLEAVRDQTWSLVSRPDVVLTDGRALVVEANADSPAGLFALHDILLRAQQRLPDVAETVRGLYGPNATEPLADLVRKRMVAEDGVVAIAYWRRETETNPPHWYYGCHARELGRYGIQALVCPVEELELGPDEVRLRGERVAAVYRFFEAPEANAAAEQEYLARLLACVEAGTVGLFSGYRGEVCASKIVLALLSDERYVEHMPAELAVRLERHIPWTRLVQDRRTVHDGESVDLLPWIREHRDDLVLKAVRGRGGEKVLIGGETDPAEWDAAITAAHQAGDRGRPWIVQRLVRPPVTEFAATDGNGGIVRGSAPTIYSVFVLERRPVGVLRRIGYGRSLNINGRSGFVPAPVWWEPQGLSVNGQAGGTA